MTPEGKVKAKVKRLLNQYEGIWYDMPVPGGFGKSVLDFNILYHGRFLVIETKREGEKPTGLQVAAMRDIVKAGGSAIVLAGLDDPGFEILQRFLDILTNQQAVTGVVYGVLV